MAIATTIEVIETQQWPQGDIRDPLGLWGARKGVTGDASGGSAKVEFDVAADKRAAYLYTIYSATWAQLTGTATEIFLKARILTNWPDVDPDAGVQAFATLRMVDSRSSGFSAPINGPQEPLISPNDRFILCFDPRQQESLGVLPILEIEASGQIDTATYSFEAWGYFWDRSVANAPGGPRHPGSS